MPLAPLIGVKRSRSLLAGGEPVKRFPVLVRSEELGLKPDRSGKVREIFDLGDELLLVATDRISAFDVVMDQAVPGRGALLTQMTVAWYDHFGDRLACRLLTVCAGLVAQIHSIAPDRLLRGVFRALIDGVEMGDELGR